MEAEALCDPTSDSNAIPTPLGAERALQILPVQQDGLNNGNATSIHHIHNKEILCALFKHRCNVFPLGHRDIQELSSECEHHIEGTVKGLMGWACINDVPKSSV